MKKAKEILNVISTVAAIVGFVSQGASYGIVATEKIKGWKAQKAELKAADSDFDDFLEEKKVEGSAQ